MVTRQLQVERRTGKVRRSKTNVLPLYHANKQVAFVSHQWQTQLILLHGYTHGRRPGGTTLDKMWTPKRHLCSKRSVSQTTAWNGDALYAIRTAANQSVIAPHPERSIWRCRSACHDRATPVCEAALNLLWPYFTHAIQLCIIVFVTTLTTSAQNSVGTWHALLTIQHTS